jgi:hypothetical protein
MTQEPGKKWSREAALDELWAFAESPERAEEAINAALEAKALLTDRELEKLRGHLLKEQQPDLLDEITECAREEAEAVKKGAEARKALVLAVSEARGHGVSLRDCAEAVRKGGVKVSHTTINTWVV